MPVTGLYFIPEPTQPNAPPPQSTLLDRLQKRHQPTAAGPYRFDHRLLRSNVPVSTIPSTPQPSAHSLTTPATPPPQPTYLQFLDLPHLSQKLFVLCGTSILTVDRDFSAFVKSKLGSLWTHRQTLRAEGNSYDVDDFRIRIGHLLMGEQVRGCVVELEYTPCDRMEVGEGMLRDFIDALELPFAGRWVLMPKEGSDPAGDWSILDTGRQYCELLRFR